MGVILAAAPWMGLAGGLVQSRARSLWALVPGQVGGVARAPQCRQQGGSAPGRPPGPRHSAFFSASGRLASYARSLRGRRGFALGKRHL